MLQLTIASILMVLIRIVWTGSTAYAFIIWNLILAFLPWTISLTWKKHTNNKTMRWISYFVWLLFLPNAPYLMTDLFHLRFHHEAPMWYDLMLIFSAAFAGLMLFYMSVFNFLNTLNNTLFLKHKRQVVYLLMFLTGYGIYLGRIVRLNSWDIISSPIKVVNKISYAFMNMHNLIECASVTLLFALFLYLGFKIIVTILQESKKQFNEIK